MSNEINVTPAPEMSTSQIGVEEWRLIEDPRIQPRYYISNFGRVMNAENGNLLSVTPSMYGYLCVTIVGKMHETIGFAVHRLVAQAFLPPPLPGQTHVDHIDGNPLNNAIENLRWASPAENMHNPITLERVVSAEHKNASKRQHLIVCDEFPGKLFTAQELAEIIGITKRSIHAGCAKGHGMKKGGRHATGPEYHAHYLVAECDADIPTVTLADALEAASKASPNRNSQPIWVEEDRLGFPSMGVIKNLYHTSIANIIEHCDRFEKGLGQIPNQGFKPIKHFRRMSKEEYQAWLEEVRNLEVD